MRRRIIRHIVRSAQQGNPSDQAIRHWNALPDQKRFGHDPATLRKHFAKALPKSYSVQEDLTIGIPGHKRKAKKQKPGERQGMQANPPTYL